MDAVSSSTCTGTTGKHDQHEIVVNKLQAIHQLHNEAINLWGSIGDVSFQTEAYLLEALGHLHDLCREHLTRPDQLPEEMFHRRCVSTVCVPETKRSVGGDKNAPLCFGFTMYNHAFVLDNWLAHWGVAEILLTTSVVCYNVALFYHTKLRTATHSSGVALLQARLAQTYYLQANHFVERYLESTRAPIWHLQASIYYNFAMMYRDMAAKTSDERQMNGFRLYIEQLSIIANWVQDREARAFFSISTVLLHKVTYGKK